MDNVGIWPALQSHLAPGHPKPVQPRVSDRSAISHDLSVGLMSSVWLFGPYQSADDVIKRSEGLLQGELV